MSIEDQIRQMANEFALALRDKVDKRVADMEEDDDSHFLIYQVLGVSDEEGRLIDIYQNKGRFLYRYAGTFLEKAAIRCLEQAYPDGESVRVPNNIGRRPKTFQIDFVAGELGIEIKWRDATTDGDHITKEHTRILAVSEAGYRPIRVMFYYPNREQSMRIQRAIASLYRESGGEYYDRDAAWSFILEKTGIDLKGILETIAQERGSRNEG